MYVCMYVCRYVHIYLEPLSFHDVTHIQNQKQKKNKKKNTLQLLIHKQTRHALARPDAHTRQQHLLLLPPALAQTRADLSGARRSERVTQCDGSAAHVHLGRVDAEDVGAVDGHGGESLVEFDEVDVGLEVEVELGQELGDGEGGADAHDAGGDAGDGGAAEFAEDGLVHLLRRRAFHEEDGGGWERR